MLDESLVGQIGHERAHALVGDEPLGRLQCIAHVLVRAPAPHRLRRERRAVKTVDQGRRGFHPLLPLNFNWLSFLRVAPAWPHNAANRSLLLPTRRRWFRHRLATRRQLVGDCEPEEYCPHFDCGHLFSISFLSQISNHASRDVCKSVRFIRLFQNRTRLKNDGLLLTAWTKRRAAATPCS